MDPINITSKNKSGRIYLLIPFFGTLVFVILYIVATFFYPGGSQHDRQSLEFSWMHNYWCNLLSEKAINGRYNSAQPIALAAMVVLSLTLSIFWLIIPVYLSIQNKLRYLIQISGIIAMAIPFFYFSHLDHDTVTNLASFFGLIAALGTLAGLYKIKWTGLFLLGLAIILLIGLNNYFYYREGLIIYLPLIQKISFAVFLIWISCISINVFASQIQSEKFRGQ